MKKVSVVVPIYNVEKYLEQCLDSIARQTLKDIEVICVNDGSTDNSLGIIERFATNYDCIKIVNKENGGLGSAYNAGLNVAAGEYIALVEPDDFIKLDMYEKLYNRAKELDVDIIKSAFWMYFDDEKGDEWMNKIRWAKDIKPPSEVFKIEDYPVFFYHHPSIWSALYKKSFLDEKNIRFGEPKGAAWIDNPFNMQALALAERIAWDSEAYYYYRQTNSEASSNLKDYNIPIDRVLEMQDFIKKYPEKYKKIAEHFTLRILAYVDICANIITKNDKNAIEKILQMMDRIPKEYISDNPVEFAPFLGRLLEFKNTDNKTYLNKRLFDLKEKN